MLVCFTQLLTLFLSKLESLTSIISSNFYVNIFNSSKIIQWNLRTPLDWSTGGSIRGGYLRTILESSFGEMDWTNGDWHWRMTLGNGAGKFHSNASIRDCYLTMALISSSGEVNWKKRLKHFAWMKQLMLRHGTGGRRWRGTESVFYRNTEKRA